MMLTTEESIIDPLGRAPGADDDGSGKSSYSFLLCLKFY